MGSKENGERGRGGFSLAEILIATLILSLITALGARVVHEAVEWYKMRTERIGAELLATIAAQVLADEVRYGREWSVSIDNRSINLISSTIEGTDELESGGKNGTRYTICLEDGRLVAKNGSGTVQLLNSSFYDYAQALEPLSLVEMRFTCTGGNVEISFSIENSSGEVISTADRCFTVAPLNAGLMAAQYLPPATP